MSRLALAAAGALLLAGPAFAQARSVEFTVDRTVFTVPLIPGYCDEGEAVEGYLKQQRRDNPGSLPDVVMMPCGARGEGPIDMFLVFVSRKSGGTNRRADLLDFLTRTLPVVPGEGDLSAEPGATVTERLSARLARRVGAEAEVRPVGVDEVCAYVGGRTTRAGGTDLTGSGCTTVISGYVFQVSRYRTGGDPAQAAASIPEVKALALSIGARRQ